MNPYGGSEQEALALYGLLRGESEVHLWATSSRASRDLLRHHPIRRVLLCRGHVPRGGTYVFVGAHWRNRLWPYLVTKPERLIYLYNTFHPKAIDLTSRMPRLLGWPATEYVLISAFQQQQLGLTGPVQVHPSPIDIAPFAASPRPRGARPVIGRLSRDALEKHDPKDFGLYRELARDGCTVRLQGATCIADYLAGTPGIEITPAGARSPAAFLHDLDIFYYRSGEHVETFGRVVFEAMACGKPVVCHAHGGYAEWIRHGHNGFLYRQTDEARTILKQLLGNPGLCQKIGAAARATAEGLYADDAMRERLAFYRR